MLKDANLSITGLAIRATGKQTHLFVATQTSVFLYNITVKDKEFKSTLDTMGCARRCSVLADTMQDGHFMIGRNDVSISCGSRAHYSFNLLSTWTFSMNEITESSGYLLLHAGRQGPLLRSGRSEGNAGMV